MELENKIVVVTGAGSGIGKALAARFVAEGARAVVAADLNEKTAQTTADELGCHAMSTDVTREQDIRHLVEETEANIGPIDLFCSNAGVAMAPGFDSSNSDWQTSWDVNVMSHVYAARHLVPRMCERGGGYFLITVSAAGLLNQIAGAAYGTTKHAALGFSEWLALTYAHDGIKVSALCPQAVNTPLLEGGLAGDGAKIASADGVLEPDELADVVVQGLDDESFLILPHAQVLEYMRRKTADYDRWIGGMNRLVQRLRS